MSGNCDTQPQLPFRIPKRKRVPDQEDLGTTTLGTNKAQIDITTSDVNKRGKAAMYRNSTAVESRSQAPTFASTKAPAAPFESSQVATYESSPVATYESASGQAATGRISSSQPPPKKKRKSKNYCEECHGWHKGPCGVKPCKYCKEKHPFQNQCYLEYMRLRGEIAAGRLQLAPPRPDFGDDWVAVARYNIDAGLVQGPIDVNQRPPPPSRLGAGSRVGAVSASPARSSTHMAQQQPLGPARTNNASRCRGVSQ